MGKPARLKAVHQYRLGLSRNKVAVPEGVAGTPPFWSAIRTLDAVEFKARAVHNLPISLFDIYGKAWPQQAEFSSLNILR